MGSKPVGGSAQGRSRKSRGGGNGRARAWIAPDACRIADGALAEHWDVLQDEAMKAESKSGLPMFGQQFAD
jgi:predicted SnoaL-like aldol condensation-catalyzing enzyme